MMGRKSLLRILPIVTTMKDADKWLGRQLGSLSHSGGGMEFPPYKGEAGSAGALQFISEYGKENNPV